MQQIHMARCPQIMQRERLNMNVHKNKWRGSKKLSVEQRKGFKKWKV
jgi:hypothetical protein